MLHHLPHEIIADIFSRLPSEYVLRCKEVCRTWRNLLRLIKRNPKINLLFAHKHDVSAMFGNMQMQLDLGEYDEKSLKNPGEQLSYKALTQLGYPRMEYLHIYGKTYRPMVGSHRGLVCFCKTHNDVDDPIYICNPFTELIVLLPYLYIPENAMHDFVVSGFGYLYATNEYKVVRIHYSPRRSSRGQVQVYTLGDKIGWRNKEDITYRLSAPHGVLCDGALHWIDDMGSKIIAFDLADEKFRSVKLPDFFPLHDHYAELLLLRGNLSVIIRKHSGGKTIIWSLEKTKNESGCKNWKKECTIPSEEDMYHPFAITEENKVLMFKNKENYYGNGGRVYTLSQYDPNTAVIEEFEGDYSMPLEEYRENLANTFRRFQVIPYMKSNVSLEALEPDLPVVDWDIQPNPLYYDFFSCHQSDSSDFSD